MNTAIRIASTAADGGYVAGQRFHAYYPDFQGNVHVVASDGKFLQSNHYYPYGLPFAEGVAPKFQPHKYSGKEFLSDRSLNLYDFHARLQDPIIGGFDRMDPCLEDFYDLNPYIYCSGNPICNIDPTEKKVIAATKEEQQMILDTLPEEDHKYIEFDEKGVLNVDKMLSHESNSVNFNILKELASDKMEISVIIGEKFYYKNKNGGIFESQMWYDGVDVTFLDPNFESASEPSSGECGFLGKTL